MTEVASTPETTGLDGCLDLNQLTPAAQTFVTAIADVPDLPLRLAKMSLIFHRQGQRADAMALARAAKRMAPADHRIRVLTEWLNRFEAPLWHFPLLHDELRNEVYARALKQFVRPGMAVFEIGCGTGILAMLAVQAGARHVYTCERRTDVAEAARVIIERNGFSERITVIGKDAHALRLGEDLPERADLFVAEIVDNGLLGESVLPLTQLARERFLKPDAILLPREISAMGYLMTGEGQHENYRVGTVMGFDLTPFNRFTPATTAAGRGGGRVDPLSEAVELAHFDLRVDAPAEASRRVALVANRAGQLESILRWLRLDFGDGIVFENRPPQCSAWYPLLHVLPESRWVEPGDRVDIEVYHSTDRLYLLPISDV